MKLRKLHLQNYKVFDDAEFDFTDSEGKTLDTIVLAGANGCGKTTVLELLVNIVSGTQLKTLKDALIISEWELSLTQKKAIKEELELTDISSVWNGDSIEHIKEQLSITSGNTIKLSYLKRGINFHDKSLIHFFQPKQNIFEQKIISIIYIPVSHLETKRESPFLKTLNIGYQNELTKTETFAIENIQKEIFKNKHIAPQATIERAIFEVNNILSDFNLSTKLIDIESEHFVFQSFNGKKIYFDELSNGEKHLYFNAIYLHNLKLEDCIILVDEPEIALHPSWQKAAVKFYEKIGKNNQVILATHSPHIMASVKPESLFVLHLDKEKNKVQVLNMGKEGKHSKGLEPNRILTEIMEVENLREFETQQSINRLSQLLNIQQFDSEEAQTLLEKLQVQLGQQDSFIIRANHQMLMLNRQKEKQNALRS